MTSQSQSQENHVVIYLHFVDSGMHEGGYCVVDNQRHGSIVEIQGYSEGVGGSVQRIKG